MRPSLDRVLKFRQLRMIEAMVRLQSITRASADLGVSQPALTKSLRELEDMVGEPLFARHPRGLRPTAAGFRLAAFARAALSDLKRLEESISAEGAAEQTPVVVGALPVAAVGLLPAVMNRVRGEHPELRVRLVEGRTEMLLGQLEAGEVDLIIGRLYSPTTPDGLMREALYAEPINVMTRAGHPLHRIRRPTVKDVFPYDLVLPEFSQRIAHDIDHYMAGIGLESSARSIRSTSRGFIREMLLASDMVTIMPRMVMGGDLLRGHVRLVPLAGPPMNRPAGVITNPRRGVSSSAQLLIEAVRRTIADLATSGDFDITK
jgi:LysR family pca operon transcriptional activator